jgi:hypothetical protein
MIAKGAVWAICHYEDEPQRVDFPDLIEISLFQRDEFSKTEIVSAKDSRTHVIKFRHSGKPHTLHYFIRETVVEMRESLREVGGRCRVVLSMMDLSLNGDREKGAYLVQERVQEAEGEQIWMVTGYPVEARRILDELDLDVRVIAKPPNHRVLRDEIVEILLEAITASHD